MAGGVGIAFEGCGCRAAFHVGVLEELRQRGVRFEAAAGTSSGSILAAAVAFGLEDQVRATLFDLLDTPIFRPRVALRGSWPWRMSEIVGSTVRRYFGDRRMHHAEMPLCIPVTLLGRRGWRRVSVDHRCDLPVVDAILASCFIPGPYHRRIRLDCRTAFDGAITGRVPCDELHDLGARTLLASVSHPSGRLQKGALLKRAAEPPARQPIVIKPSTQLAVSTFDFDRQRMLQALESGAGSARRLVGDEGIANQLGVG